MFVTFNMGNYEEDTIGHKLRYIDAISEDNMHYGTLERYTSHYDPESSMYGRKMNVHIKAIKKFVQEIEKEIRDTKKRIDYYVDAGKMGGQRESELRNIVQNYYKMKLEAFKTQASFEREKDKSRKEDLKLYKELTGSSNIQANQQMIDDRSSDRAFMTSLLGSGVDNFFSNTTVQHTNVPIQPVQPSITPVVNKPEPLPSNPVQEMKETVAEKSEPDFSNTNVVPKVDNNQITGYIKNANGEDVPLYAEGPEDFLTGVKTYTDAKLAYENISLSNDPNVQKFFKFNEQEGMGWLVYYDMENKKTIEGKGSLRNIEQVFPFEIDKQNGLVTTVLRETYPVLFTDEKPTEEITKEYERLQNIVDSRKQ